MHSKRTLTWDSVSHDVIPLNTAKDRLQSVFSFSKKQIVGLLGQSEDIGDAIMRFNESARRILNQLNVDDKNLLEPIIEAMNEALKSSPPKDYSIQD